jgi:hypothetical protein
MICCVLTEDLIRSIEISGPLAYQPRYGFFVVVVVVDCFSWH